MRSIALTVTLVALVAPGAALAHHPPSAGGGAALGAGTPGASLGAPSTGFGSSTTVGGVPDRRATWVAQSLSGSVGWKRGFGLEVSVPVVASSSSGKAPSVQLGSASVAARGSFLLGSAESSPRVTVSGAVGLPSTWSAGRVRPRTTSLRPGLALSGRWRRVGLGVELAGTGGIGEGAASTVEAAAAATLHPLPQLDIGVEVRVVAAVAGELAEVEIPVSLDLSFGVTVRPTERVRVFVVGGGSPLSGFDRAVSMTVGFGLDWGGVGPEPAHAGCSCEVEKPPPVL